jgi:GTP cyclohydrolase II
MNERGTDGGLSAGASDSLGSDHPGLAEALLPSITSGPGSSTPVVPMVEYTGSCELPTTWGNFRLHGFIDGATGQEHVALSLGEVSGDTPVLARVHSECLTGDALFSQRCDCGAQLKEAMKRISAEGRGLVLYMRQEGRGIGLINKIRAYRLQDAGADTVEANITLGFPADMRRYHLCKPILEHLGVTSLRLMTNNPKKLEALEAAGVVVAERIGIVAGRSASNRRYLQTKQAKLGHLIPLSGEEGEGVVPA